MQIFLQRLDGSTAAVEVQPGASVDCLIRQALPQGADAWGVYVKYGGRLLRRSSALSDGGVHEHSTLQLGLRLRGGGGDGGATGAESRDCYLKMYADKKPDKVDPYEQKLAKWTRCGLCSEVLKPPCVMDMLGNIYNKEEIVQALLTKTLPKRLSHIKGLKDVLDIKLTSLPGVSSDDDISGAKFQCPVTGQEMNGKFKFFALRSCGHVLSARAFKELGATTCAVCLKPFTEDEKVVINGSEEEVLVLRQRFEDERAAKSRIRGEKKQRKPAVEDISRAELVNPKRKSSPNGLVEVVPVVRPKGSDLVQVAKKLKAEDHMPVNATKEVYASIFTSSSKGDFKETYSCRSLPIGRN